MRPYLRVGDIIEFVKGKPIPNGRICLVRFNGKEKIRLVFREGVHYRLKPLDPRYKDRTEYVYIPDAETFIIVDVPEYLRQYTLWEM